MSFLPMFYDHWLDGSFLETKQDIQDHSRQEKCNISPFL